MSMDSSIGSLIGRSLGTLCFPCPTAIEGGAGVEVREERFQPRELGLHLLAQLVVDLDGLGDQLPFALWRSACLVLSTQLFQPRLCGDDGLDLVEVEPDE